MKEFELGKERMQTTARRLAGLPAWFRDGRRRDLLMDRSL